MREVAIVATAQAPATTGSTLTTPELLVPVLTELFESVADRGVQRSDIDFWCHGSCDYLTGQPFSFVSAVDAIGAWPPINESHVEADGAFALYEAWLKIQTGEANTAVAFSNGKSTSGPVDSIMSLQLDPYTEAPLDPGMQVLAALQARLCIEQGLLTERDMAASVARSRLDAVGNPAAWVQGEFSIDELLGVELMVDPLRSHDCGPISDGANAVILAASGTAEEWCDRPAWISGIDHRVETQRIGARDLTESPSTRIAADKSGYGEAPIDVAELHAPFSHQELILRRSLAIGDDVAINPSGGALVANPQMAAGLARLIEVADRVHAGSIDRGLAHATSGPCLQQNLVAIIEGRS